MTMDVLVQIVLYLTGHPGPSPSWRVTRDDRRSSASPEYWAWILSTTVYNMFFIFKSPVVEVALNAIASYWPNPGIVTTSLRSQAQIRPQAPMASAINMH